MAYNIKVNKLQCFLEVEMVTWSQFFRGFLKAVRALSVLLSDYNVHWYSLHAMMKKKFLLKKID